MTDSDSPKATSAAFDDYIAWLNQELDRRALRNPRYSMRALARDLAMPAPHLSEVLRGKRGLSPRVAAQIARRLELPPVQAAHFVDLATARHARSPRARADAKKRIEARRQRLAYSPLDLDRFKQLTDWAHLALLELVKVEGFRGEIPWIASALEIPEWKAADIVRRLERLGLLSRKQARWELADDNHWVGAEVPSLAIKRFHQGVMRQAQSALYRQSLKTREFGSLVVAIDDAQVPRFKQRLKDLLQELDGDAAASPSKTQVYCFSVQMFRVDHRQEPGKPDHG